MENQQEFDSILSQIENLETDILRFSSKRDELKLILDQAKLEGYKTPSERLEEERAANAAEKKRRLEAEEKLKSELELSKVKSEEEQKSTEKKSKKDKK